MFCQHLTKMRTLPPFMRCCCNKMWVKWSRAQVIKKLYKLVTRSGLCLWKQLNLAIMVLLEIIPKVQYLTSSMSGDLIEGFPTWTWNRLWSYQEAGSNSSPYITISSEKLKSKVWHILHECQWKLSMQSESPQLSKWIPWYIQQVHSQFWHYNLQQQVILDNRVLSQWKC